MDWGCFDKFKEINEKYLPETGAGKTMAERAVTAVNKLVYRWYNDGDIFDNVLCMVDGYGDLSSYANWLWKNIPEARVVLDGACECYGSDDYECLLYDLACEVLDKRVLERYEDYPAEVSLYDCPGPFEVREEDY